MKKLLILVDNGWTPGRMPHRPSGARPCEEPGPDSLSTDTSVATKDTYKILATTHYGNGWRNLKRPRVYWDILGPETRCLRLLSLHLVTSAGRRRIPRHSLLLGGIDTYNSPMDEAPQMSALSPGLFLLFARNPQHDDVGVAFRFLDSQEQGFILTSSLVGVVWPPQIFCEIPALREMKGEEPGAAEVAKTSHYKSGHGGREPFYLSLTAATWWNHDDGGPCQRSKSWPEASLLYLASRTLV